MRSVSVVVPVLNGAATIGDMLNALLHQSGAPQQFEIIVVDNGSTDSTCAIIEKFAVTMLHEPKRGPAAARNRGLRHASGEIIVHLDADTLPTRSWLREIVAPFADPDVILVGGKTVPFRPDTPAERYVARVGLYNAEFDAARPIFPFVASVNMATRRLAALAVGGFSEDMLTAEDMDFCYRLLRQFPSRIVYQSSAVLFHRNRSADTALCRQAWAYGEGAAQLYARYPDVLRWGAAQTMTVCRTLAARTARPPLLRIARSLGSTSDSEIEFARYHRMWTWWYWRGFYSYRRYGVNRLPGGETR